MVVHAYDLSFWDLSTGRLGLNPQYLRKKKKKRHPSDVMSLVGKTVVLLGFCI
jgi:hypothetical protein